MSVEASRNRQRVAGKAVGPAFHQNWKPTPACVLDPAHLAPFVTVIAAAIAETKRARGCGTYLFVDTECRAYLLPEDKTAALEWVRTKFPWLVALYEPKRKGSPGMDVERIGEDIADHLQQLGVPQ